MTVTVKIELRGAAEEVRVLADLTSHGPSWWRAGDIRKIRAQRGKRFEARDRIGRMLGVYKTKKDAKETIIASFEQFADRYAIRAREGKRDD